MKNEGLRPFEEEVLGSLSDFVFNQGQIPFEHFKYVVRMPDSKRLLAGLVKLIESQQLTDAQRTQFTRLTTTINKARNPSPSESDELEYLLNGVRLSDTEDGSVFATGKNASGINQIRIDYEGNLGGGAPKNPIKIGGIVHQ